MAGKKTNNKSSVDKNKEEKKQSQLKKETPSPKRSSSTANKS